jgi:hypothetical protein
MTIYKVNYMRANMDKYFMGANDYFDKAEKLFTTEEKAKEFVATEETVFVGTWGKNHVVKKAGVGVVEKVEVE